MPTHPEPITFGYVRVSTNKQNDDRQIAALIDAGVATENIFSDKISGVKTRRPGLDALLSHLRPHDVLQVVSLDRLGRSSLHILQTIHDLTEKGVTIKSLKNGEDLSTPNGKLMAAIFSALAEWERELINERAAEGRAARAANGSSKVRPKTALSDTNIAMVRALHQQGMTPADIVDDKRIRKAKPPMSRASVYRALAIIKEQVRGDQPG